MRHLIISVVLLLAAQSARAEVTYLGTYVWTDPRPDFGGLSALHLSENGLDFVALSDRGLVLTGTLTRIDGVITDVDAGALQPLTDTSGQPLGGLRTDSEGIAVDHKGVVFIAFEGDFDTRVDRYDTLPGPAVEIPSPREFSGFQSNASLEALAIDRDGALYTLPERSGRQNWPFPVFRYDKTGWRIPFDIPRRGAFLIAGADIGPDNQLYILERDFTGLGFRTRVRRFALDGTGEETLIQTGIATHDNLEGISVWEDQTGLRMTLVSDDNFRGFQQTEIVEYRINN